MAKYTTEELLRLGKETNEMDLAFMSKPKNKFLPCPRCQNEQVFLMHRILSRLLPWWFYVECGVCHWCGKTKLFQKRAIKSWNRASKRNTRTERSVSDA